MKSVIRRRATVRYGFGDARRVPALNLHDLLFILHLSFRIHHSKQSVLLEHLPDAPQGLARARFILYQGKSHMVIPIVPETRAG